MKAPAHLQEQLQAWFPPLVLSYLRTAGEVAAEKGYSLYLIGGGVRDMLLQRPFDWDVDLVSESYAVEKLAQTLQRRWGGQLQAFAQYGTAKLRLPEAEAGGPLELDFATARTERYAYPGANPEVSFSTLDDDLIRRDFSVNAMAVGLLPHQFGALIDPFGGWQDLQGRCLRALHDQKFIEDPVRCWRAARMSEMLGFELEASTRHWSQAVMEAGTFDYFFSARMRRELSKLFDKADPWPYFAQLRALSVLRCLDPGFDWAGFTAFAAALSDQQAAFPETDTHTVWLLGLVAAMSEAGRGRNLSCLELTRQQFQAWEAMHALLQDGLDWTSLRPSQAHARLKGLSPEAIRVLSAWPATPPGLQACLDAHWHRWRSIRPRVSGTIIKDWLPPGPHIRRILDQLLAARLDGLIESEEQELELARRLAAEVTQP